MNSGSNMKPLLKPFGCTLCPLSFALAKSLVKHVEVHKTKLQVGNSKNNFVEKEKNSVPKQEDSVQKEKNYENFVQKEKNSGNFVQKEDSKNVKANLKKSDVNHRHRVNSLDFELGSDFYRPFKGNSIQKNDQNESKQSKSTENLKNNQVYAESDKKPNDSIKSEETKFIVKRECLEVTSSKIQRQRLINKDRAGGTEVAEGRNRSKTFTLERPSIDLGTPKFSDPPPALKGVHSCNYCTYTSDQMWMVKRHERIHTGKKPFSCKFCTYTSSFKHSVKRHEKTHSGKKPFSCKFCSYTSSLKHSVTRHEKTHTARGHEMKKSQSEIMQGCVFTTSFL